MQDKEQMVVDYALLVTGKPVGVAQYRLVEFASKTSNPKLPTTDDLASKLPLFNLAIMRIRLDRALQEIAENLGTRPSWPALGTWQKHSRKQMHCWQKWPQICGPSRSVSEIDFTTKDFTG